MNKFLRISPFVLIGFGTLGLLLNEFLLDWGTLTVLIFAFLNLIGLIILGFVNINSNKGR